MQSTVRPPNFYLLLFPKEKDHFLCVDKLYSHSFDS